MQRQELLVGIFQDDKIMEFLVEKSKTATSPVGLNPLIEEFVRLHGHYHDPDTICRRFREKTVRKIHAVTGMSDEDKARVLFVTSIPVNKTMLAELEKHALVELDTNRRIIKFTSFNELVKFEGTHQRQVPLNTINSPAPADPKKRKVKVDEEQKEPPMKKTRGEEEEEAAEEMVVVREEEVMTSEVAQNLEELPEVQDEASQRAEDHVENVVAPDAPGLESAVPAVPGLAPEVEKEVELAAGKIGAAPDAPEKKEEPKKDPALEEAAPKAAQDTPKAPEAQEVAPEAPEEEMAAQEAPEEEMAAQEAPEHQEEAPRMRGFSPRAQEPEEPTNSPRAPKKAPKHAPKVQEFPKASAAPEAPKQAADPQDLPMEFPLDKEVKPEIEDDLEDLKVVIPAYDPVANELREVAKQLPLTLAMAIENAKHSAAAAQNDEGTSSPIRRSSRKSYSTWRRTEPSESSEPVDPRGTVSAAPAASEAAEGSDSRRVTRSRTSTHEPKKEALPPKSVAKTTPVAAKTVKKAMVSSPIIKPKGMEASPEIKKRGPKTRGKSLVGSAETPKSSKRGEKKTPGPKAAESSDEAPHNVRRSTRMSEKAAKIASAPPTPAPVMPVATRNVTANDSGSKKDRQQGGNPAVLPQGPSTSQQRAAPNAHASGSTVTTKHFLEHTRQFVATIATPKFAKLTKRFDTTIEKMKDDNKSIDSDKLQKVLQSTISILTSKK